MVAPGDNLDFHGSPAYLSRIKEVPEIHAAVLAALKNHPLSGTVVAGRAKELRIEAGGRVYAVFIARRGNSIGLIGIYDGSDAEAIEAKRRDLRILFKQGDAK